MTITENRSGNSLTIALEGRLETSSAPELDAVLQKALPGIDELIFNFEKLEYVSSAGLRVLLSAHKALMGKKGMTIRNANELIMEVFEVTGFDSFLTIEK